MATLTLRCTSSEIYVTRNDGAWYAWHVDANGGLAFSRKGAPTALSAAQPLVACSRSRTR